MHIKIIRVAYETKPHAQIPKFKPTFLESEGEKRKEGKEVRSLERKAARGPGENTRGSRSPKALPAEFLLVWGSQSLFPAGLHRLEVDNPPYGGQSASRNTHPFKRASHLKTISSMETE